MPTLPNMDVPKPVGTASHLGADAGRDDDDEDDPALSSRQPSSPARPAR